MLKDEDTILNSQTREIASMLIDIDVSQDGVFSAFVATDFSDLNVFMQLMDKTHGQVVALEKTYMIDEVSTRQEDEMRSENEISLRSSPDELDQISSIQLPLIRKGQYQLKLSIPVAFWYPDKKKTQHCLTLDFVSEFIPKSTFKTNQRRRGASTVDTTGLGGEFNEGDDDAYDGDMEDDDNPFTLVSIYPP